MEQFFHSKLVFCWFNDIISLNNDDELHINMLSTFSHLMSCSTHLVLLLLSIPFLHVSWTSWHLAEFETLIRILYAIFLSKTMLCLESVESFTEIKCSIWPICKSLFFFKCFNSALTTLFLNLLKFKGYQMLGNLRYLMHLQDNGVLCEHPISQGLLK
jgi:hypothetical protein